MKCILKMVKGEIKAAECYIALAEEKKEHEATAELFLDLAKEELGHAERLIKHGQDRKLRYMNVTKEEPEYEHYVGDMAVWEYAKTAFEEEISELKECIRRVSI